MTFALLRPLKAKLCLSDLCLGVLELFYWEMNFWETKGELEVVFYFLYFKMGQKTL